MLDFLNDYPRLSTFITAMLPVIELRGAIPIAIGKFGLSSTEAFFYATAGNILPNIFILALLEPALSILRRHFKTLNKVVEKIFAKTRHEHSKKFNRYGAFFLFLFVAIPIPGSGGWTGSLIAFLFKVPYKKAIALISAGIITAGLIITFLSEAIAGIWNLLV